MSEGPGRNMAAISRYRQECCDGTVSVASMSPTQDRHAEEGCHNAHDGSSAARSLSYAEEKFDAAQCRS
jgi:hypothetical protein